MANNFVILKKNEKEKKTKQTTAIVTLHSIVVLQDACHVEGGFRNEKLLHLGTHHIRAQTWKPFSFNFHYIQISAAVAELVKE